MTLYQNELIGIIKKPHILLFLFIILSYILGEALFRILCYSHIKRSFFKKIQKIKYKAFLKA
jgi:hypothetical protein